MNQLIAYSAAQLWVAEDVSEQGYSKNGTPSQVTIQPMPRVFIKNKGKLEPFLEDTTLAFDFKDTRLLVKFLSEREKILPRKLTGLSAFNQRQVAKAIKRAQNTGLLASTSIVR